MTETNGGHVPGYPLIRRQETEVRRQKTGDRSQKSEVRRQKTGDIFKSKNGKCSIAVSLRDDIF